MRYTFTTANKGDVRFDCDESGIIPTRVGSTPELVKASDYAGKLC